MYKNTTHTVTITDFGTEGEGICKIDGYTLFVPNAVKGDVAEVLVVKENKNFGFGKLLKVTRPSPLRTEPLCPVFSKCGGCSMQSVSYDAQLDFKKDKVLQSLIRIGGFQDACITSVTGSDPCYHYRNKAQFPVTLVDGKVRAGFYAPHSHRVVVSEDCPLQDNRTNEVVKAVCDWATENNIPVFNEENGKGLLRRICLRIGKNEGVLVLVSGGKLPKTDVLTEKITKNFPYIKGIVINYNHKLTNNVYGEKDEVIYGVPYMYDFIGDIKYKIHYRSFYQVNPYTTKLLYEKALELASPTKDETVFDLYCGGGTISLFLAKKAKRVIGIEIIEDAVKNAKENAELNSITNAEFYCGEAEIISPRMIKDGTTADIVVVDPPRKGCGEKLLSAIGEMKPDKLVYVSCDNATMARDAKILREYGYEIKEVHVFDQFPQTGHTETVALLTNLNALNINSML